MSINSDKDVKKPPTPLQVSYDCSTLLDNFSYFIQKVNLEVTVKHIKNYKKETDMSLKDISDDVKVMYHSSRKRKLVAPIYLKKRHKLEL